MSQAELLGIDLERLETERFTHPIQIQIHAKLRRQAEGYWSFRNQTFHDTPETLNNAILNRLARKYATGSLIADEKTDL